MSHEIEITDGKAQMFYHGEVPWHGLGTKLENPATSKEALVAAGLDWEVGLMPVFTKVPVAVDKDSKVTAKQIELPNFKAVVRNTDNRVYNIVHNRYTPIQNKDSFDFFDAVVGSKEAIYHTAGSLHDGARIWILAKLNGSLSIKGDEVEKYLLLSNSHDGSLARQMFFTPIRVVCANTLAMAENQKLSRVVYSRHTKNANSADAVRSAQEILGLTNRWYVEFKEKADYLATHMLPAGTMPLLLKESFGLIKVDVPAEDIWKPIQNDMATITRLFEGEGKGLDNPTIKGTKWAVYNAITEYVDHYRSPRRKTEDSLLNSAWFGSGNMIKERALDILMKD